MKRLLPLFLLGLSACGNYSNEDLDFQLALPGDGELEVKMPQALTLDGSPEYYKSTRNVVTQFNALARALVGLVDKVRGITPTSRQGTQRTWGPWPDDKHPGWQIRVLMDRVDDPGAPVGFNISYKFQVRSTAVAGAEFKDFMTGTYAPSGNARRGSGQQRLDVEGMRGIGYPVDDFEKLKTLDLCYQTLAYPMTIHMLAVNQDGAKERQVTYDYEEAADGSGTLFFDLAAADPTNDLRFISRWLGSGAGRADAYLVNRNFLLAGTDCWGPDTLESLTWRVWLDPKDPNESSKCVFAEPTSLETPRCGP